MDHDFDPTETPVTDLAAAAASIPDQTFLTVAGRTLSYRETWSTVTRAARGLRSSGVGPGDRVVIMAPNSLEAVVAWFAVQLVGAVDAPVSVEATGTYLAYVLDDLEATAAIGTAETLDVVDSSTERSLPLMVRIGDGSEPGALEHAEASEEGETLTFDALLSRGAAAAEEPTPPSAWDLGTIMYSSGTTGPSKGVMLSHGYYSTLARVHATFATLPARARIYCAQPLCHIDARSAVIDALHLRGEVILGSRFSASRFWDEVEQHDADVFFFVGTMIHLLFKQPERPGSASSRHRIGLGSATPASIQEAFQRRFDVDLVEGYGMTEFGVMAGQRRGTPEPGTVGAPLDWVEARLVDGRDVDVPRGHPGELIVRPRRQHLHMLGYWRKPEATVEAWRGLWFHTGDVLRELPTGSMEYVGRTKDSIRRRGENVSAWEVEEAAARYPTVLEAAAIGVPADLGDEDVALLVVPAVGGDVDAVALREHLTQDLPRYALPRFVEVVDELPKTPSERIAKAAVRDRGLSAAAHDFESRRS